MEATMIIRRPSPNERAPRRPALGTAKGVYMKRFFLGGILTATTLAGGLAVTSEAFATQPTPPSDCDVPDAAATLDEGESLETPPVECPQEEEHKVWVCHATSGEGELKNGYNLIFVDVASTIENGGAKGENDHYGHSKYDPKVNKKFGVYPDYYLYDYILTGYTSRDEIPKVLPEKCGATPPENVEVNPFVTSKAPTCDAAGSFELSKGKGYTWTEKEGTWTASVDQGYYFGDTAVTTFTPGDLTQLTAGCETTTTVTTVKTVETVASQPAAQIQVASQTPAAPAQAPPAPAAAVSAVPTQLPSTGSSSWVTALIALVTLLGGTGLVRLSRRPTD
jgi:LPXTG-motif cell wall-anchored protein